MGSNVKKFRSKMKKKNLFSIYLKKSLVAGGVTK